MNEHKKVYFDKLGAFIKAKLNFAIQSETKIGKIFPLRIRYRMFNELEEEYDWVLPDFELSRLNIFVRILVILLTLGLVGSTVASFMFYVIINDTTAFLGTLAFCLIFPFSVISFFYPTYIKKSGFGNIKTVDDFINELYALNRNR